MLFDIIFLLVSILLTVLRGLYFPISFTFNNAISDGITYFLGYARYIEPYFPISTLFQVLAFIVTVFIAKYTVLLINWIFKLAFKRNADMPSAVSETITTSHVGQGGFRASRSVTKHKNLR